MERPYPQIFLLPPPPTPSCMSDKTSVLVATAIQARNGFRYNAGNLSNKVIKVKDLTVGDRICGLDKNQSPATCVVETVGGIGRGLVYDNYTDEHYAFNTKNSSVQRHGTNGIQTVKSKYIVVTSCLLGVNKAGIGFTPFDSDVFGALTHKLT